MRDFLLVIATVMMITENVCILVIQESNFNSRVFLLLWYPPCTAYNKVEVSLLGLRQDGVTYGQMPSSGPSLDHMTGRSGSLAVKLLKLPYHRYIIRSWHSQAPARFLSGLVNLSLAPILVFGSPPVATAVWVNGSGLFSFVRYLKPYREPSDSPGTISLADRVGIKQRPHSSLSPLS